MPRRHSNSDSDSLELLLDTICNVFGGIILMAILVVLQAKDYSQRKHSTSGKTNDVEMKLQEYLRKADQTAANANIEELRRQRSVLEMCLKDSQSTDTSELIQRHKEFEQELNRTKQRKQEAEKSRADLEKKLGQEQRELIESQDALEKERQALEQSIVLFKKQYAKTGQKFRLPQQHITLKYDDLFFFIDENRVYPFTVKTNTVCEHTTMTPICQHKRYKPIPGKGIPIYSGSHFSLAYKNLVATQSSNRNVLTFIVSYKDQSFRTFQAAKKYAIDQGFEYRVWTYNHDEGVILSPAASITAE